MDSHRYFKKCLKQMAVFHKDYLSDPNLFIYRNLAHYAGLHEAIPLCLYLYNDNNIATLFVERYNSNCYLVHYKTWNDSSQFEKWNYSYGSVLEDRYDFKFGEAVEKARPIVDDLKSQN